MGLLLQSLILIDGSLHILPLTHDRPGEVLTQLYLLSDPLTTGQSLRDGCFTIDLNLDSHRKNHTCTHTLTLDLLSSGRWSMEPQWETPWRWVGNGGYEAYHDLAPSTEIYHSPWLRSVASQTETAPTEWKGYIPPRFRKVAWGCQNYSDGLLWGGGRHFNRFCKWTRRIRRHMAFLRSRGKKQSKKVKRRRKERNRRRSEARRVGRGI